MPQFGPSNITFHFSTISNICKSTFGTYGSALSMVLGNEEVIIFGSKVHRLFMYVQNCSQEAFVEGPCAKLASTRRFGYHFRFSGFPKIHFLVRFSTNGRQGRSHNGPVAATRRSVRIHRPQMDPGRPETRPSSILDRFSMNFDPILSNC